MNRVRFFVLAAALAPMLIAGGMIRFLTQRSGRRFGEAVAMWFHRTLCAALGVRIRVLGASPQSRRMLVVANHVSWLDIPVLGALHPITFVAKKEVGNHWLGRLLAELQGVIFVDRRRRGCIPQVNRDISASLARGAPVALFAEATTGDGNRLLRFRSPHFEALRELDDGEPALVQPVFIAYTARNGVPLGRLGQPLVAWYGDMTFFSHLFRFLREGPFDCEMTFGAPIRWSGAANRKAIAREAQTTVKELAVRRRRTRLRPEAPAARPWPAPITGEQLLDQI
jgi:1-acyl-sn-glycerol-3-phosphate acyltransferase